MARYTFDEKVALVSVQRQNDSPLKRRMVQIRDRVNGDYVIPLSDVDGEPSMPSPTPQLIADAIDMNAARAASTRPTIAVPAIDETKLRGKGSREFADYRRRLYYGVWHNSAFNLLSRRGYRHLAAYGEMAGWVTPGLKEGKPRIQLRNPLSTYPEPREPEDFRLPNWVGFIHGHSAAWIRENYGTNALVEDMLSRAARKYHGDSQQLIDVLEFVDEDEITIGILGPREEYMRYVAQPTMALELITKPNRAGVVPAAVGHRVTLDRVAGMVSNVVGSADLMERLMALEVVAAERSVFPDRYLIGEEGRQPTILNGRWQDGREGEINVLENVKAVGEIATAPSFGASQMVDRLERSVRLSGGNPAIFGGELTGNVRSGSTVNALGSFSIDPMVQELQETGAHFYTQLNEAVFHVIKGYYSGKSISMYSGWPSDRGKVEVDVDKHMEIPNNDVSYAFAGVDANAATVMVAQLTSAELMSRSTGRRLHPLIDDERFEEKSILSETLQGVMLQGFIQQVQEGTISIFDAARIDELVQEGASLAEAIQKQQREAQERQATAPPPPGEGQVVAPETQPGLSAPGVSGVEAPSPTPEPPGGVENFRRIAAALTLPAAGMLKTNQEV